MKKQEKWLELSYEFVAENGFDQLSENAIARMIDKSKSSFYHHFGDLENFKLDLLDYHYQRAQAFTAKVEECENIYPGIIHLLLEHKVDMFFHKQVRINRNQPASKKSIEKVFKLYEDAILEKWIIFLDLGYYKIFVKKLNRFMAEHFFLSITQEEYNYEWLNNYLKEIKDE